MLMRSGGPSKPRIVGNGDQEVGSFLYEFSAEIGEDDFVTDKDAEIPSWKTEIPDELTWRQVSHRAEASQKEEKFGERDIFAEGDEVNLVISSNDLLFR